MCYHTLNYIVIYLPFLNTVGLGKCKSYFNSFCVLFISEKLLQDFIGCLVCAVFTLLS